ncbi:MAG: AraC family transcriptional regulator [Bacillota bacterium]|nr:AraC family transcriptional regulator [Bacillota bacterium]
MSEVYTVHFAPDEKIRMMVQTSETEKRYHKHNFLELVYITNGKALHHFDSKETILQRGSFFIVDYGTPHQYKRFEDSDFGLINCLFIPSFIDETLVNCRTFTRLLDNYLIRFRYQPSSSPINRVFYDEDGSIYALMQKLVREYEEKAPGCMEVMRCNLIEVIIRIMRRVTPEKIAADSGSISSYIVNFINEHYMESPTLSNISSQLNFSLPYLSRKFKEDTGMTFLSCLQKVRIEQSCRLLANTDKKVVEIAGLVGYDKIKFFNAVFKKHMNVTPNQFRRILVQSK